MFETHVFARSTAHSAVLYWDKPAAAGAGAQYTVYLGGQPVATCGRTHFTLTDLRSQSDYQADVFFGHQCVGSCVFRTTPVKNRLDVTEAPFWAKGDGKTKNTAALQRAIDACGGSAQGQSAMAKLNTKVSIGMKTITDKSTRNLAEMLTQGSSMGVMDCIKSQKDYPDAAPGSKRLMQKLQDFEEDNRLKLEQYL